MTTPNGTRYPDLFSRLVANTRVDDNGCWIWTGAVRKGYPSFTQRIPGRPHPVATQAHRAMLEISTGYLFPFDEAGHYLCFTPLCIRPCHLRVETPAENLSARRGYAPCEGRLIPVLFPTAARLLDEAAARAWDVFGEPAGQECPF